MKSYDSQNLHDSQSSQKLAFFHFVNRWWYFIAENEENCCFSNSRRFFCGCFII